jgi:hypothetical protein
MGGEWQELTLDTTTTLLESTNITFDSTLTLELIADEVGLHDNASVVVDKRKRVGGTDVVARRDVVFRKRPCHVLL